MRYLIGIDALGIDQPGGARTAVFYLLKEIFNQSQNFDFIIYVSKFENEFTAFPHVKQKVIPLRKGIVSRILAQFIFVIESAHNKFDLFHFTKSQGSLLFKTKSIITIFDLTILREPKMFSKIDVLFWKKIQPKILSKMKKIITISNDVANDLKEYYLISDLKIDVVYCATQFENVKITSIENLEGFREKYELPPRYLLFLGIIAQKKNLNTLIKAYKILTNKQIEIPKLILAGPYYPKSDGKDIFKLIHSEGLSEQIKYIGKIDISELSCLYQSSEIFIMPSVHEGFGIPVLEAMQHGIPIIVSNASSLPEVVGDAGLLVNDYLDPDAWAKAIELLISDEELRKSLIMKGKNRVKKFNWRLSAEKTIMIYNEVLVEKY
jgi:glycosyltransferase involved in cell wall biosynthesis